MDTPLPKIPKRVQDIPDLIRWIADTFHDGIPSRMHERLGISIGTANFWARGAVLPNLTNLQAMAEAYALSIDDLIRLWRNSLVKRRPPSRHGGAAATPPPPVEAPSVTARGKPYRRGRATNRASQSRHYVRGRRFRKAA